MFTAFLVTVAANVTAGLILYGVCKWLDKRNK